MEEKRFDQLARTVARSGSRRRLLAGLLAGTLGGLRLHATSADDDGVAIADASGGNDNSATTSDQVNGENDNDHASNAEQDDKGDDHDGDNEGHDNGGGQGHEHDDCNDADCPPDQSTNSSGPGSCCKDGFCSCGGECCGGPDCWIVTTQVAEHDPTVRETCTRPAGCLQCPNSGGQCCADCTRSGDCVSPCINCPGEPSANVCCAKCIDSETRCQEIPDTTPISGGIIRRR